MATTPKGIWTPDSGDGYDLTVDLAQMADTVDTALDNIDVTTDFATAQGDITTLQGDVSALEAITLIKHFRPADTAALNALTGMAAGDLARQTDTALTYRYSGTGWIPWESDWITWTTAPTNLTVGTGGAAASLQRYKWIGGRLWFDYMFTIGSSGASVGTSPTLNLPVNVKLLSPGGQLPGGDGGAIYDLNVATVVGFTKHFILTTNTVRMYWTTTASPAYATITATSPMTPANGDTYGGGFWADPA